MYPADISIAARFAARVLTQPPPTEVAEVARVQELLTDLAVVLTHTTTLATGLHPRHRRGPTVVDMARRPEQVLLDQLAAHATGRTSPPTPSEHGGADTATSRWAGHPTDPATPAGPVALWQGAVVHAFLAAADLDRPGHHLDDPASWAVLSDTASLAQALAAAGRDLPHPAAARPRSNRLHDRYARLALAAREVAQLAAPTGMADQARPAFPRSADRVVIVTGLDRLAPAIHQLARILTVAPTSAEDLISVTRALAQTAHAAATLAGRTVPTRTASAGDAGPAAELTRHAEQLTAAVAAAHTRLASLDHASPLAAAQARELSSAAVPRLHTAARRPDLATAAAEALHVYTAAAPAAARALTAALTALHTSGALCVRDRSRDAAPRSWRRTRPGDLTPVLTHLLEAAAAVQDQEAVASPVRPAPHGAPTRADARRPDLDSPERPGARAGADPARVLDAAIRQRHAERRPARPGMNPGPAQTNTLPFLQR